jgi:hypothetical protein
MKPFALDIMDTWVRVVNIGVAVVLGSCVLQFVLSALFGRGWHRFERFERHSHEAADRQPPHHSGYGQSGPEQHPAADPVDTAFRDAHRPSAGNPSPPE